MFAVGRCQLLLFDRKTSESNKGMSELREVEITIKVACGPLPFAHPVSSSQNLVLFFLNDLILFLEI